MIRVDDETTLEGELAEGTRPLGVVVCHPLPAFGGTMQTPFVLTLYDAFADAGFPTLRFNFRGVGRSTGKPTGGKTEHHDVAAAVGWMAERCARVAVVGYSFGGLMAMRAIGEGLPVAAGVAIGLPTVIVRDNAERIAHLRQAVTTVPWLLVSGTRDQFSEVEMLRSLAPPATLELLEGVGHFYDLSSGNAVVSHILPFLTGQ